MRLQLLSSSFLCFCLNLERAASISLMASVKMEFKFSWLKALQAKNL